MTSIPTSSRSTPISLSKLDVARRQLETATTLWFAEGDPVSIHTLVAAAHRVVHDVAAQNGKGGAFMVDEAFITGLGYDPMLFKKAVRRAETFFKHADRDADDPIDFSPDETEFIFASAIDCYHRLSAKPSRSLAVMMGWIHFRHPDTIADSWRMGLAAILPGIQGLTRREFYRQFGSFDFSTLLYRKA